MAPLEGGLVGDPAQLNAILDGNVPGHELDEAHRALCDPVAVDRGEHSVAPLEGGLVGDPAQLNAILDGNVPGHELDEAHPRREILLAVPEDGAGRGAEARPALRAPEPAVAGGGPAVPDGARGPAARAARSRSKFIRGFAEGAAADLVAARARGDGLLQQREVVVRHGVDLRSVGVVVDAHSVAPSAQAPTQSERRKT